MRLRTVALCVGAALVALCVYGAEEQGTPILDTPGYWRCFLYWNARIVHPPEEGAWAFVLTG